MRTTLGCFVCATADGAEAKPTTSTRMMQNALANFMPGLVLVAVRQSATLAVA